MFASHNGRLGVVNLLRVYPGANKNIQNKVAIISTISVLLTGLSHHRWLQ